MARMNLAFAEQVAAKLEAANLEVKNEPSVGGLTPDFVVTLSNQRNVVIEAKGWKPTEVNLARARREAEFFRSQLGALDALVVLPEVPDDHAGDEVLGLDSLVTHLIGLAATKPASNTASSLIEEAKQTMFCAMPYDESFDDVFRYPMRGAASDNGLTARRVDQDEFRGDVVDKIKGLIKSSAILVADMSGSNPNVMYEVGYADGLGIPVIPICSTPLDKLPFDVAQQNTILYSVGQTGQLVPKLSERVARVLPE